MLALKECCLHEDTTADSVAVCVKHTGRHPSPPIYKPKIAQLRLVILMKINIDELTMEEIHEVVDRLRNLKIETKFRRLGSSVVLQTEQGPVQLPQNEAVAILGVPAMF
jgi:hypothetical protein